MEDTKEANKENRKNIPKPETVKPIEVKPIEVKDIPKETQEKITESIKNEPDVQKAVKEMKASGLSKEEIEDLLNKAAKTFMSELLSAIQGEQVKETVKEPEEIKEPEEKKERTSLFG